MDVDSENTEWFSPVRFGLLLAGMVGFCFPGILIGTESFVLRDFTLFGYPLAHFHRECFWQGELPLWNPYNHCGIPFLAQWNTLCLYPLSLIYLLPPLIWGLGVFCVLHLYAGGMGMYFLARNRTGCGFAATVAGVLYAFNGLTQNSLMWPNNIAALGLLPWVLLAVSRAMQNGGPWVPAAGLIGGLQMLSGAPEVILMTWTIAMIQGLLSGRGLRPTVTRGIYIVGVTAGLAALQLVPFLDLLFRSSRTAATGGASWAMAADGWCHLFVPAFRTVLAPAGFRAQVDQFWTLSYHAGICGMVLALIAWRSVPHRREVAMWWCMGLAGLGLASGDNGILYPLLGKFLPLETMRFPVKFVMVLTVAVPMAAAFGAGVLTRRARESNAGGAREWLVVGAMVVYVAWKIRDWTEFGELRRGWMDSAMLSMAMISLLALASCARDAFNVRWWGLSVLLICFVDLRLHAPSLTPTISAKSLQLGVTETDPTMVEGRSAVTRSVDRILRRGTAPSHEAETEMRLRALIPNLNLVKREASVGGFFSLRMAEEIETSRRLYQNLSDVHRPLADFMGIRRIATAASGIEWHDRPGSDPRVTVGRVPIFLSEAESLDRLASDDFQPRNEVLLMASARETVQALPDSSAVVTVEKRGLSHLSLRCRSTKQMILAVAESWHPNWQVTIDGTPARLLRVNHSFQGVEVPAGDHLVKLQYRDRHFMVGSGISIATLLLVLGGLYRRKKTADAVFIEAPQLAELI